MTEVASGGTTPYEPIRVLVVDDHALFRRGLEMVLIEACVRLLPGVIGAADSLANESFEIGLLEYPQYTKPRDWEGRSIPEILLSGDHKKIEDWRRREADRLTADRRPDLLRQPGRNTK